MHPTVEQTRGGSSTLRSGMTSLVQTLRVPPPPPHKHAWPMRSCPLQREKSMHVTEVHDSFVLYLYELTRTTQSFRFLPQFTCSLLIFLSPPTCRLVCPIILHSQNATSIQTPPLPRPRLLRRGRHSNLHPPHLPPRPSQHPPQSPAPAPPRRLPLRRRVLPLRL